MRSIHRWQYHQGRMKRILITIAIIVIVAVISIYSLSINSFHITFQEAWEAVYNRIMGIKPTGYIEKMIDLIAIDYNAPRAIAAILVGTILAVSGAVMQTVTRNPLAEPYTIGISSAALFGMTISVILGICIVPGLSYRDSASVNAFFFALIPAMAIVGISSLKKLSPNMMILVGIGMMYLFSSMTTFLKFNSSEEKLEEIYVWSLGTLSKVDWNSIMPLFITACIVLFGMTFMASRINMLMAGDNVCQTLGVNPVRTRIICFVIVSIGVAVSVCYTGTIGFVGLVAPHITRLFTGNNNKILIPTSAVVGALMIIVSDVIVRMVPGGLPAGVITAAIGSPIFLYFLFRQRTKSNF